MPGNAMMVLGALAGVSGTGVLRLSWGREKRSAILNAIGWGLLVVSTAAGWAYAGAFGIAVASLWAMTAAFALLSVAASRDPAPQAKGAHRRESVLLEQGEPRHLSRRITTFSIVILGGLAMAIALGIMTRWAALLGRASEADANVLAFFAVPFAWAILTFLLLMTPDRKRQLMIIAGSILASVPAIAHGSMA